MMGAFAVIPESESIAYGTIPSPSSKDAMSVQLSISTTTSSFFDVTFPYKQVKAKPSNVSFSDGDIFDFGVLIDVDEGEGGGGELFSWLPFSSSNNRSSSTGEKEGGGRRATVSKSGGRSVISVVVVDSSSSDSGSSSSDGDQEEVVGTSPLPPTTSITGPPPATGLESKKHSTSIDDFDCLDDDMATFSSTSVSPADSDSSSRPTTPALTPPPPPDRKDQQASLMHQVGSILIGSRVGQMVVTGGASAVSVAEFDAARIKTGYSSSPIYMLGVEYRMLSGGGRSSDGSSGSGAISLLPTPVYHGEPNTADLLDRVTLVHIRNSPFHGIVDRRPAPDTATGGDQTVLRRVIVVSGKGHDHTVDHLLSTTKGEPDCRVTARQERLEHEQRGPMTLIDISFKCASGRAARSCRLLAEFLCKLAPLETHLVLQEQHNVNLSVPPTLTSSTLSLPSSNLSSSSPCIIPHSKQTMKNWKQMGGQVYYYDADVVMDWVECDLRVTNNNCLCLVVCEERKVELVLSQCRLVRSGDGSCRLALVKSGGHVVMIRTVNRSDYAILVPILDAQCATSGCSGGSSSGTASTSSNNQEWIEQNAGIISEFLFDFQSRFWFTYRRNFERIGTDSLLTTDAGWGCMLRVGQSMVAEALARTHLGREWRLTELRERADVLREYVGIVELFLDEAGAVLSVHRLAVGGTACGLALGQWFGPTILARVIKYAQLLILFSVY
jgi:hypothetical protein